MDAQELKKLRALLNKLDTEHATIKDEVQERLLDCITSLNKATAVINSSVLQITNSDHILTHLREVKKILRVVRNEIQSERLACVDAKTEVTE
nr:hypothetical protein [Chrysanthemum kita-like virus]